MVIAVDIGGTAIKIARIEADAPSSPPPSSPGPPPTTSSEISDRIIMAGRCSGRRPVWLVLVLQPVPCSVT